MGAVNSYQVQRDYPRNPPSCTQCPPGKPPNADGGFIGLPSNETCVAYFGTQGCTPLVSGWDSGAVIFLYFVWGLTIALALVWACLRDHLFRDKRKGRVQGQTSETKRSHSDDPIDEESQGLLQKYDEEEGLREESGRKMTIEYLRSSKAETVAFSFVVINGLVLLIYYLLLTLDFYLECENIIGSVDNACFFGTFRVFGNYENNAEIFFLVWIMMVAYCLLLASYWQDLFDWVAAPASEEDADKVRVWIQDDVQILGSGHMSWATRLKRWGEKRLRRTRAFLALKIWGETAAFQSERSGRYSTVPIHRTPLGRRYFLFEAVRYAVPGGQRIKLTLDKPTIGAIRGLRTANGPDPSGRADLRDRCGPNAIPLTLPSFAKLLAEEFLTPFYAYQLTIYLIWIWWTYWFVGLWLLIIVVAAGMWSVHLKRKSLKDVYALAEHHEGVVVMADQKDFVHVPDAAELVCGDVVKVAIETGRDGWIVPADLILTDGSCAVDESGLTGESMPRSKIALPSSQKDSDLIVDLRENRFKQHVLYAGTKVLDASAEATAVVMAVGTDASRGQLLSHVLFPVTTLFRFDEEFSVAVFLLLLYSLIAFSIAIAFQTSNGSTSTWPTILAYGVMTISQIVSPMLKIALVAGRVAATRRLKNKGIACLDAHRIDIAGKVRVFCFDKTGTLTKDGLSLEGFAPILPSAVPPKLGQIQSEFSSASALRVAATCHSLAFFDGQYLGSGVEVAMFQSTGWSLKAGDPDEACSPDASIRLTVRRRLAFDQHRRTMSVVVEEKSLSFPSLKTGLVLYVKGSPESIVKRCRVETVSLDLLKRADELASEGCYVLCLAQRDLAGSSQDLASRSLSDASRDELEADLECLGLLVFRNELKGDASPAIAELKRGNVRCVMITGDSAACGCFIAKQARMVGEGRRIIVGSLDDHSGEVKWTQWSEPVAIPSDAAFEPIRPSRPFGVGDEAQMSTHGVQQWDSTVSLISELGELSESDDTELALTGDAFVRLKDTGELYDARLLWRVRVFARMSPTNKVQAVHAFMDGPEGVVCAMCGDGGNDSGALRAAHVGLSMSAAEASVVAPFSSQTGSVMTSVQLIIEGRAALATSLASYKYLVIYGLLFSIVKMASFYYAVLMPLMGYVMIDFVAVVPLTFAMTLAKPLDHLGSKRPTSSLLGVQTVTSVTGFLIISMCSMSINLSIMSKDSGYVQWPSKGADTAAWWFISDNYEATVIWITCFLLFISSTFIFSFGSGYRDSVFKNYILVLYVIALYLFASLLLLLPLNWIAVKFHIASEQFNRLGTENPVWQKYQAEGGQPSPAMSFELRLLIWLMSTIAVLIATFWERVMVFGPGGRALKRAYKRRWSNNNKKKIMDFGNNF